MTDAEWTELGRTLSAEAIDCANSDEAIKLAWLVMVITLMGNRPLPEFFAGVHLLLLLHESYQARQDAAVAAVVDGEVERITKALAEPSMAGPVH